MQDDFSAAVRDLVSLLSHDILEEAIERTHKKCDTCLTFKPPFVFVRGGTIRETCETCVRIMRGAARTREAAWRKEERDRSRQERQERHSVTVTHKACRACGETKPRDQFPTHKGGDGLHSYCRPCVRKKARESYERNKQQSREAARERRYGISAEEYERMLRAQGRACALCARPLDGGKHTHTDHCHETGVVRGLLCASCNTSLGKLGDDVVSLERAAEYLREALKRASEKRN